MKAKWTTFAVTAIVVLFAASAFADGISIPIVNPSFEVPNVGGVNNWNQYLDGWTQAQGTIAGVWQPSPTLLQTTDGINAAWVSAGSISQTLTSTLQAYSGYTLSVDVGQRNGWGPVGYMVQLLAGGVVLAQDNSSLHPAGGTFATSVLTYDSGNAPSNLIGQNLEIRLIQLSNQVSFDNVRLTDPYYGPTRPQPSVPEPATITLFASGGAALVRMVRRKRA